MSGEIKELIPKAGKTQAEYCPFCGLESEPYPTNIKQKCSSCEKDFTVREF